jgi:glyoxylase-like metal-dependent hydrolase (beta-lactamase superfamily II)
MELLEGIYQVDEANANMAHSNVYFTGHGNELTLTDTGTSRNAKKIVAYIQKMEHRPSDVTAIDLTHFHMDHVGSAKELKGLLPNANITCTKRTPTMGQAKSRCQNPKTCSSISFRRSSNPQP